MISCFLVIGSSSTSSIGWLDFFALTNNKEIYPINNNTKVIDSTKSKR